MLDVAVLKDISAKNGDARRKAECGRSCPRDVRAERAAFVDLRNPDENKRAACAGAPSRCVRRKLTRRHARPAGFRHRRTGQRPRGDDLPVVQRQQHDRALVEARRLRHGRAIDLGLHHQGRRRHRPAALVFGLATAPAIAQAVADPKDAAAKTTGTGSVLLEPEAGTEPFPQLLGSRQELYVAIRHNRTYGQHAASLRRRALCCSERQVTRSGQIPRHDGH